MSWEETRRSEHRCPCGAGTYTVVFLMDDWNRTEERWTMNCSTCKNNYVRHTFWYLDSGMTAESYRWVRCEALHAYQECVRAHEQLQRKISNTARVRHLEKWRALFTDCHSKKAVWLCLTGGRGYPSLPTFYAHIRPLGVDHYIEAWFTWQHLPEILYRLKVTDADIQELLADEKSSGQRCDKLQKNL